VPYISPAAGQSYWAKAVDAGNRHADSRSLKGETIMKTKTNVKAGGGDGGVLQVGLINVNDVNILDGNAVNIFNNSSGCGCGGPK